MRGLRILTLAPRIDERDGILRARSSWLVLLLSLGLIARQVVVDRRSRYLTITTRHLWFLRRHRVIPFRQIHRLTYDYERTVTSIHRDVTNTVGSGDELDSFRVGLVLRARDDVPETHAHLYEEHIELFGFHGEGQGRALVLLDAEGQQETLSRRFVERLRALTGVGLGHELPQLRDEVGQAWTCPTCSRPGPPRAGACYYCGGALTPKP